MKAVDIILDLLPIPVITGIAVICGTAWLIKELSGLKSYGPVLKSSKFRRVLVIVVVAVAGYGTYAYFRDADNWRFAEDTQGILVAKFKNDPNSDVQIHIVESLREKLSAQLGSIEVEEDASVPESPADARALMERRNAKLVVWGAYVVSAKVMHTVISDRSVDRRLSGDFPNVDEVVSAVSGIFTPPVGIASAQDQNFKAEKKMTGLAIGIDRYDGMQLFSYSEQSAVQLAEKVGNAKVLAGAQATRSAILAELERVSWIYFSGLTVREDSNSYLVAADGKISIAELQQRVPSLFLILDGCCAEGPVTTLAAGRKGEPLAETAQLSASIFTRAVLDGLSGAADLDRNGAIQAKELHSYVEREVVEVSRERQHPQLIGDGSLELATTAR